MVAASSTPAAEQLPYYGELRSRWERGTSLSPQLARNISLENQPTCLHQEQTPYFLGRNPTTSHFLFLGWVRIYVEFLLAGGMLLAGK